MRFELKKAIYAPGLVVAALMCIAGNVGAEDGPDAQSGEELDPLAELMALGDAIAETGPEGGGSIRAKRDIDPVIAQRMKDPRNIEGKVEMVRSGRFPAVAVKIKVTKSAREGAGKDIKRNTSIVIVPNLKIENAAVKMTDPETRINAGAFYFKRGDRVVVRLGGQKGKVWNADYVERK